MKNISKQLSDGFKELLKHPVKLLPTIIIVVIWLLFSMLSAFNIGGPILRFLCGLTYSNGGMYGGFFGALGGIFGKAVFAAFINAVVFAIADKKKLFSADGLKGVLKLSAAGGLAAAGPFVTAGGVGLLLYWFFNITSDVQNCIIGLVGAVTVVSAAGKQNGLLFNIGFGILNKLSKGKAPSKMSVSRVLTGFSMGFALGFALTFIRNSLVLVIIGAVLVVAGIVASIIGGKGTKAAAAAMIIMFLLPSVAAVSGSDVLAADWYSAKQCPGLTDLLSGNTSGAVGSANQVADCVDAVRVGFGKATSSFLDNFLDSEMYGCPINSANIGSNNLSTVDIYKGGDKCKLTVDGFASCYTNGKKGDYIDYSMNMYNVSYKFELEFTDIVFESSKVQATVRGTENLVYGLTTPDEPYKNGEVTNKLSGADIKGKWYVDGDKLFVLFVIPGDSGSLSMYLEVDRVLPKSDGKKDTAKNDSSSGDFSNNHSSSFGFDDDDDRDYDTDDGNEGLPKSTAGKLAAAALTAILGGLAGAAGGAVAAGIGAAAGAGAAGTVGAGTGAATGAGAAGAESSGATAGNSGFGGLDGYITRDADGDLNVTDPATGEKRLYKANGDGTYTNPMTGATYTETELAESIGSRAENADVIRQDQAVANEAINKQREDNQKLSQGAVEYSAEKAKNEETLKRELYNDKLEIKYGVEEGDKEGLKEAIGKKQEQNEESAKFYEDRAEMFDKAVTGAEVVQVAADTGVDVLANMTGTVGQGIKKGYTIGKNMATRLSEAVNSDDPLKKDIPAAFAMAGFDSLADITQDALGGKGWQICSNVGSEVFKGGMQNLYDGKDFFEGAGEKATKGAVKGVIDKIGSALGDNQKNITKETLHKDMAQIGHAVSRGNISPAGERALRDMRLITYVNNLHAEQAVEAAATVAGDLAKTATDGVFDAYDEIGKQISGEN